MATPSYPLAWLLTAGGEYVVTAGGERVQVVTDPAQAHDRVRAVLLEVDADTCLNTFGVAPCTATGTACYNTFATCKDKANYARAVKTWRFALRGQTAPAGEQWRPYITDIAAAPTEIKPAAGLALRSQTQVTLTDENDSDTEGDPYASTRTAAGTFWGRFVARNPNIVNRQVRLRRGWWGQPFSYSWFADETYIVDRIAGPDRSGQVRLYLSDPVKLLDRAQIPAPTGGKLSAAIELVTFSGTIAAATTTTAVLPAGALPDATAYVGQELRIVTSTGAGQRRTITGYDPATATVTVSAWSVVPDGTSTFEIVPLSATLGSGEGAQYASATHVRIGKEIIKIAAVTGDTLSWASSADRAQFGSTAQEHGAGSAVQACAVWLDAAPTSVVRELLTTAGLIDAQINISELASIAETWLRNTANITACVSAPAKASDLLKSLLTDLGLMQWWDPATGKVRTRINLPDSPATLPELTDDELIAGSASVERLDAERITQAALFYAQADATEDGREARQFLRGEVRVDLDAERADEYADSRPDVRFSTWLTADNQIHAAALTARRLNALRDAPIKIAASVDPRTEVILGDLHTITTRGLQGADGDPEPTAVRVVRILERDGSVEFAAQSAPFGGKRWGFIAPNGQANYGSATAAEKQYAYICATGGTDFADGGKAYRII